MTSDAPDDGNRHFIFQFRIAVGHLLPYSPLLSPSAVSTESVQ
ncbi:hypothetical protein VB713_04615 [Anabaena cylindrica UHCC 0172]|nr:hypothetical protein [Anabaena cylindrica UHCC 0172]